MLPRTRTPEHAVAVEVKTGDYVTKSNATLRPERAYASLSHARTLPPDYYWIGVQSNEIAPRVPEEQTYEGRTFEGVPSVSGYFRNNKDGTFTQLQDKSHADWQARLYV